MIEPAVCRHRCRHRVRPLASIAQGMEDAARGASVELVGTAPYVEQAERQLRASLSVKVSRLLEELNGACFACALTRVPTPTVAPATEVQDHG